MEGHGQTFVDALSDSTWAVSINASGALARLGDPTTAAPICRALSEEQTSAYRWTNLLIAAEATGAPCARNAASDAFRRTQIPLVKSAAARVIGRLAVSNPDAAESEAARAMLRSCRAEDPSEEVRDACDQALGTPSSSAPRGEDNAWIEFYLYSADGRRLRPRGRFLLILPDGLVKAGITDSNGFAREAPVAPGVYRVEEPGAGLRTIL
jgi:hypothetical protein